MHHRSSWPALCTKQIARLAESNLLRAERSLLRADLIRTIDSTQTAVLKLLSATPLLSDLRSLLLPLRSLLRPFRPLLRSLLLLGDLVPKVRVILEQLLVRDLQLVVLRCEIGVLHLLVVTRHVQTVVPVLPLTEIPPKISDPFEVLVDQILQPLALRLQIIDVIIPLLDPPLKIVVRALMILDLLLQLLVLSLKNRDRHILQSVRALKNRDLLLQHRDLPLKIVDLLLLVLGELRIRHGKNALGSCLNHCNVVTQWGW